MKLIKVIIEKTKDMYSSYAENVPGIYGGGDTVDEAKTSILDAIRLLQENNDKKHIPLHQFRARAYYRDQSKTISTLCFRVKETTTDTGQKDRIRFT
jgi:predicted RNase H-like HicB family nuclease